MDCLNLGCGYRFHPSWTNVNFTSTGRGVIAHDLTQGIPFPDASFDVVYHSHLLKHFPKNYAKYFLQECCRVLRTQGMNKIIEPIIIDPLKHIYKMLTRKQYLQYNLISSKLKHKKRYSECKIRLDKWNLFIPDAPSFLSSYKEILLDEIYKFHSSNHNPKILDIGANIGLSVLFFQKLYPEAEIVAFEADPKIFIYLKNNVHGNGYKDVKLINKAVWYENTTLSFASDGADGGRISNKKDNEVKVEAVDIAELLQKHQFNFIKMDIEGAEEFVVPRCKGLLNSVQNLFIEYHSKVDHKQNLNEILNILSKEGFRVYLHNPWDKPTPFLGLKPYAGFDFQINIFAWKE